MARNRLQIAVLAVPYATASTVHGLRDLFCSVGRDWNLLMNGSPGEPLAECIIVASRARGFRAANDAWLRPDRPLRSVRKVDLICIPDLAVAPGASLAETAREEIAWLRRYYERGATVAAACSGAMLLGHAGLLDGAEATTHWAFCDALEAAHPRARIHPARVVVSSGDDGRIITAGGGFSWLDLAIFLVARFFGEDEAMRQARIHLIDWHAKGQLPFAVLSRTRQIEDRVVAEHQAWLAEHYRRRFPIAELTRRSPLAERTLKRRFSEATGMTPLEYVQSLRLEDAKHRLESTNAPVESIALDVGYEDASFFRRLFRRRVGLTPIEYRRRFGTMRRSLTATPPA